MTDIEKELLEGVQANTEAIAEIIRTKFGDLSVAAGYGAPTLEYGKTAGVYLDLQTGLWYRKDENGWVSLDVPVAADPDKADLVNGLVPASQLPSYVDDVLEFDSRDAFPDTGEDGKIYVAKDTNKTYRWSGSVYVGVGGVDLGETASTAHRGDHGKIAYDHSQKRGAGPVTDANPHGTTGSDIPAADGSNTTVAAELERKVAKLDSRDIFAKMLSPEFLPLSNSGDASFDFSSYSVGQVGSRLVLKDAKGEVFATQANDGTFGGVAGVLFGGKATSDTWKPFLIEAAKKSDVPVLSTTFTAQDAGKAADAKAVGDKIADCMTKVTTLKINDEWRFSVAPGISGALAIRLEHLDFPMQGIWGIYTEMTIPTGLGTLAKSADVPEISTTFTEQDAGKAADAKAVGGALAGKLDSGEAVLEKDAYGLADGSRVFGFFVRKNGGIFIGSAGGIIKIPDLRPGTMALDVDIADAVKLTPVLDADRRVTGYKLGNKASPVLLTDDAKTALFAGADFIAAVKKYGGTQIKEDEKGFYYEVDEEA